MTAKEFIYSRSQELAEAIDNGYDLRLSEPDILYWMEKYAEYKAKNLPIHNVIICSRTGCNNVKDKNSNSYCLECSYERTMSGY